MKNKKAMSALIWILIALLIIGAGIAVYYLISGGGIAGFGGTGASIPQPPALPSG